MSQGVTMAAAMIRPLQRPVPLRQSVYDALIDLIVGGELPPGQHMVETDLARQLGVSRQPIREALHRMEAEGWVDLRPSQGAFVHVPTDSEVDELLDVRALLEAETARLAAARTAARSQRRPRWPGCGRSAARGRRPPRRTTSPPPWRRTTPSTPRSRHRRQRGAGRAGRHRRPPGAVVLPDGGPGPRSRIVGRARGDDRGHRVGRRRAGPGARPQAHRADPAGLPPFLIQWSAHSATAWARALRTARMRARVSVFCPCERILLSVI